MVRRLILFVALMPAPAIACFVPTRPDPAKAPWIHVVIGDVTKVTPVFDHTTQKRVRVAVRRTLAGQSKTATLEISSGMYPCGDPGPYDLKLGTRLVVYLVPANPGSPQYGSGWWVKEWAHLSDALNEDGRVRAAMKAPLNNGP